MTKIGLLNRRAELLRPSRVSDGEGGAIVTLQSVATVWAGIESRSARETLAGDRYQEREAWRVTIRYRADVRQGWTVRWDGRDLYVLSVREAEPGKKRFLLIDCEQR